jgi:hypothetical protein
MRSDFLSNEYEDYGLHVILCSLADSQYQFFGGTQGVETTGFQKILVPVYQTIWHHTPASCNLNYDLLLPSSNALYRMFQNKLYSKIKNSLLLYKLKIIPTQM